MQLPAGHMHLPRHRYMLAETFNNALPQIDRFKALQHLSLEIHGQARVNLVLAGKMLVDRPLAYASLECNLFDRNAFPPIRFEQAQRSREDILPSTFKFTCFPIVCAHQGPISDL